MTNAKPVLYDYWRSSAAYRLRIALGLLGIEHDTVVVDLLKQEHRAGPNLERNPQGLVPTLEIDGLVLTQSLAILEYLDETRGAGFLPADAPGRARVRAISYAIAMEIHPVCNLSVARYAVDASGGAISTEQWMEAHIGKGLASVERMLDASATGRLCHGDNVTMADICLVPQIYNAARWGVETGHLRRINAVMTRLDEIPAVHAAHPDNHKPEGS